MQAGFGVEALATVVVVLGAPLAVVVGVRAGRTCDATASGGVFAVHVVQRELSLLLLPPAVLIWMGRIFYFFELGGGRRGRGPRVVKLDDGVKRTLHPILLSQPIQIRVSFLDTSWLMVKGA